jgi:dihydrofolate reductase
MTQVCMIVAANRDGIIGNQNKLPWYIPEDLAFFKRVTMGYPVIMGRKTFESIGRVLPGRANYVLTSRKEPIVGVALLNEPIIPPNLTEDKVFIIGGSEVYKAYESQIDRIYLTVVDLPVEGDARLPFAIELPKWRQVTAEYITTKEGVRLCFQNWFRSKNE